MPNNAQLRLRPVLEILADAAANGTRPDAREVISEALRRVPPTAHEQELLSGGVPRGFKNLTTATARLVKAGWMSKGRGGWAVTEDGLRAIVAFSSPSELAEALDAGTPLPVAPAATAEAKPLAAPGAPAADAEPLPAPDEPAAAADSRRLADQPETVAVVGDFGVLLGADRDWDPAGNAVQMRFEPAEGLWRLDGELPAGRYAFKFALNGSWEENYGAFGLLDGANHEFQHDGGAVTIVYDHATHDLAAASQLTPA
ncbi:glycosidase [Arthrobacter sp. CAU 1506]|uniref:pullulanase X25 domain-containing protein n=1 Tax=Arthrobacter sp. CAU 1506 TaxID=2560052 RepID=UPI0010AD8DB6|nr:glycosidase [Arthrobacter sp. CAU 1506]TJY69533.1 glycosidase [Arthrobacter sp. CAU 1506]